MSASLNKVTLLGNLTRDPELKQTSTGKDVVHFSLAINKRYRDGDGELQESVTFVDITAWGNQAPPIAQYLQKGSPAVVEGELRQEKWETQEGEKRQKLCVTANSVQFLSPGRDEADQSPTHKAEDEDQSQAADDAVDLPF